jgi:NhaP-type Na+/H+ or K+/H+ antiporter
MNPVAVLTIAIALLAYGLVSRRIQGSILTGPMLFAAFGFAVGPDGAGLVPLRVSHEGLHLLAEITLILVLFSDAANLDLRQLRRDHNLPVRMLTIGLPLSIVLGAALALGLLAGFSIWEALLLAAILAPTDAALGQAVITNPVVPVRIRQTLNVESGLNDGIAFPFVLVFATVATMADAGQQASDWILFAIKQMGLGPLAGIAVGFVGAKLVAFCHRADWMSETAEGIVVLALAFAAYQAAELIGGNGFISAFAAGLSFGNTLGRHCKFLFEFADAEGLFLILLTFMAFGSAMIPMALPDFNLVYLLYAVLTLTVIRMLPVSVALLGTGVSPVTSAFLGWFGPRGLASVLYVLVVLEGAEMPHKHEIFVICTLTIMLSILLHGFTAVPAARWYGRHSQAMGECEENRPVSERPWSD